MKKLIVTFSVLFIILILTRILFAYYVDVVPVFSVLLVPLTWFSVAAGILTLVFIAIKIYKELSKK